jgi:hypothetical protein
MLIVYWDMQQIFLQKSAKETDATEQTQQTGKTMPIYRSSQNAVTYKDKQNALNLLYASMMGATIKCIGHPWIRIGKAIGIKGMGFFDGKYTVTKIKHSIDDSNKFTTEINACRLLNQGDPRKREAFLKNQQLLLQKYPKLNYSEAVQQAKDDLIKKKDEQTKKILVELKELPNLPTTEAVPIVTGSDYYTSTPGSLVNSSNQTFIRTLHPSVRNPFQQFIDTVESGNKGYRVAITSGCRTYTHQQEIIKRNHLAAEGFGSIHLYGMAIDVNILLKGVTVAGSLDFHKGNETHCRDAWDATGVIPIAAAIGLVWGGSFNTFDPVHFGYKQNQYILTTQGNRVLVKGTDLYNLMQKQLGFAPLSVAGYADKLWSSVIML